jgi:crotonobetainyl-CoA:carnitine CoA-transferase CaiB-like acyl-CoA transferase
VLPLEGVRVVEFAHMVMGPSCGLVLADLGAEVIKVEPLAGDNTRRLEAAGAGFFPVFNRNKKSLAVDLNKPAGREIITKLVRESDVFLTNVGEDNLAKWELTYDSLREVNPRLVYALCSGYGQFGAKNKPSFDMTVQALTGIMARLGEPGQPPIYLGMGSGDAVGGLMCALGVMLALQHRRKTGRGQLINASLYGAQLFLAAPTLQAYLATGDESFAKQQSRIDAPNPLWNTYAANDAWLFVCVANTDEEWSTLCQTFDDDALAWDARFDSTAKRTGNRELVAELDERIGQRSASEWLERWRAAGIPCATIDNLAALAEDQQAWANDYFVNTHCEEVNREVAVRGLPIGLSQTPGSVRSLGPELGQHTEEILVDTLGYSWEEIGALKEQGAIL